jgi:hypothetical protein
MEFQIKQNLLFNNLTNNYHLLLQQLSAFSYINTNTFLALPKIPNLPNLPPFPYLITFNNPKQQNQTLLNKKTNREEENKSKESSTHHHKNKIFAIKKIEDREKEAEEEKKLKKNIYRGSKYRGVSRNGKTWQVLIMINRNKNYIGNFKSEEEAAKVYDEYAMKFHKNKARLNFPHKGFINYVNKP